MPNRCPRWPWNSIGSSDQRYFAVTRGDEMGHEIGILQSSAMGESVYRRLGFEAQGMLYLYVRMPSATP